MGRIPASNSRCATQAGEGATVTSRRTDTVRRGQRSADSTDALAASSTGQPLAGGSGGSGSVNGSSRRPARSRAIPEMHQASGRLPSTVMSKTVSTRSPSASMIGVPGSPGDSSPRINSPAPSSERPSSLPEHNMPLDVTPRSLR